MIQGTPSWKTWKKLFFNRHTKRAIVPQGWSELNIIFLTIMTLHFPGECFLHQSVVLLTPGSTNQTENIIPFRPQLCAAQRRNKSRSWRSMIRHVNSTAAFASGRSLSRVHPGVKVSDPSTSAVCPPACHVKPTRPPREINIINKLCCYGNRQETALTLSIWLI